MEVLKIEILNPKAKKLLKALVELKLISIREKTGPEISLEKLLTRLRDNSAPGPDEIAMDVEAIRHTSNLPING